MMSVQGFPPQLATQPASVSQRTSGLAVASLIVGILGFCTLGLGGLVGLALGIPAMVSINRRPAELRGGGIALAGVIVSSCSLVLGGCLCPSLVLPAVNAARHAAMDIKTMNQIKHIGSALTQYAVDRNSMTWPSGDDWIDGVRSYEPNIDQMLLWIGHEAAGRAFAMNEHLAGIPIADVRNPARTPLLFEVEPGSPISGGPELLPTELRSRKGVLIVFADGSADFVPLNEAAQLQWTP